MTQPPPPPNQPPGPPPGGFGAPQEPPHGGFGAPTPPPPPAQPPAQPPYGYPQEQPPAQPPYGQPPQQYGYPQPPQQGQPQQPYGYPTQPMYPQQTPPPAPGGGKKLSAQMQIVIAAVVAVALIVGGGIWYANSGGDGDDTAKGGSGGTSAGQNAGQDGGKDAGAGGIGGGGKEKVPADPKSVASFQLPQPKVPDVTDVAGSWITDKAYVKTGIDSMVGYDLDKGTVQWTLPLTGQVCGTSVHMTADHKLPILFEAAKRTAPRYFQPCTEVGLVDLNTGKLVWSKSITGGTAGDKKVTFGEVTVHGQTVAAGGGDGGAAFDLANGNPRWKPQPDANNCEDLGYGGGEGGLVAVRKCGSYDDPTVTIQNLNPTSGAPIAQFKMPKGVKWASVVSTKPLVVAAEVGDTAGDGSGISDFFSIDEKTGTLKAKITADADRYAARCRSTKVESCTWVAVGNGRLYVPTEEHEGSTGEYGDETNEIVAFDLNTGQLTPNKADAGDKYTLVPLRMDGGNLIAYKYPPYDKGGQIVSIDGGTMKSTLLMENPSEKTSREGETSFSSLSAEYRYANGRFFVSGTTISKSSSSSTSTFKQYLAVGYRVGG
ncbi:PQQ-binding-like beta-propeller repeat protein [Streptomyces sp. SKN60]|uniref:outer membrane protein assembly factor BamB family protein n=1 Tax=Streptomyces sp. SKN60 TaxID=2855506 RepID=UPI0022478B9E|nr:PQQ-binding-like beta-propeller repeat protein [Streptomyces sp. SKN60]MCX2183186.1 PQQ-binding-like beta-propeller repeat protein [Streptomyces sp. SKN60]